MVILGGRVRLGVGALPLSYSTGRSFVRKKGDLRRESDLGSDPLFMSARRSGIRQPITMGWFLTPRPTPHKKGTSACVQVLVPQEVTKSEADGNRTRNPRIDSPIL